MPNKRNKLIHYPLDTDAYKISDKTATYIDAPELISYRDYIGTTITTSVNLFEYACAEAALKAELRARLRENLSYYAGLVCAFTDIMATGEQDTIWLSGKITKCEVDNHE